jgi:hypothetical protein
MKRERYPTVYRCAQCHAAIGRHHKLDCSYRNYGTEEIQGVVGLICAIQAWREWQLVGQREYIRIELQGMLARQTRYLHELEARLISS